MAFPTTLGGVGMAAVGSFPVGGSADPLKPGTFLFVDGRDLAADNRFQAKSLEFSDVIGAGDTLEFVHQVLAGGDHLKPGQRVIFRQDTVNIFLGTIDRIDEQKLEGSPALFMRVEAGDLTAMLERRLVTAAEVYANQTASFIVKDLVTKYLTDEGITTNSVQTGPMLTAFSIKAFTAVGKVLRDLGDRTAFITFVDAAGDLHFEAQTAATAPFNVGNAGPSEIPLADVNVAQSREKYRNRQTIRYGSDLSLSVTRNDLTEQAARKAVEGTSGIYHAVQDEREITTAGEATDLADALLRRFKIPTTVRFLTRRRGLKAGQSITLTFPEHNVSGTHLIDRVLARDDGTDQLMWDVTALSGEHLGDVMEFWRRLFSEE